MKFDSSLYFITDCGDYSLEEFLSRVDAALKGGVTLLQIREKNLTTGEYIKKAAATLSLARRYNVPLIIDDRVDVMLAVDADGVHVGADDMPVSMVRKLISPHKIVGATAKTVAAAKAAYEAGADYLGVGAIYPTTTHVKTKITSTDTLRNICAEIPLPVNAIGGLNKDNLKVLAGIPIAGVCAVSAIMKAHDPESAARDLKQAYFEIKGIQ